MKSVWCLLDEEKRLLGVCSSKKKASIAASRSMDALRIQREVKGLKKIGPTNLVWDKPDWGYLADGEDHAFFFISQQVVY